MSKIECYYRTLGVSRDADHTEIRKAYKFYLFFLVLFFKLSFFFFSFFLFVPFIFYSVYIGTYDIPIIQYRKLAVRWHPDKNPDQVEEATEQFKRIAEAYAILSNPQKRDVYDRYGHAGMQHLDSDNDSDSDDNGAGHTRSRARRTGGRRTEHFSSSFEQDFGFPFFSATDAFS